MTNKKSTEKRTESHACECVSRQAVLDLARDLTFENIEGLKHYRYRCIDPDDVRELPAAKIEYDVRFEDEDHVWIDGKRQYISLCRFQEAVTSAKSERKTGHWIAPKYYPTQFTFTCSKCGYKQSFNGKFKFCPNCGADMRGEQK